MSSDSTVSAMDTQNGADLSVRISQAVSGEHVVLLQDHAAIPGMSLQLTHREAYQLAVYLLGQAAAAETRETDRRGETLTEVAMVCTRCRKPVFRSTLGAGWVHLSMADEGTCSNDPVAVTAMVAAGNESIPFDVAKPAMSTQLDA
jgi:hypothetical protein